jgi:NAD(P)H-quinone oxidoreductase subunit 5
MILQDYRNMENAMGSRLPRLASTWILLLPDRGRDWLYRFALERGYLDAILTDYVVEPVLRVFRWCDRMERLWTDGLSGGSSRESDRVQPGAIGPIEETL